MNNTNMLEINTNNIFSVNDINNIKAYIDFAGTDRNNNLIVIGWVYDNENIIRNFSFIKKNKSNFLKKEIYLSQTLSSKIDNIFLSRVMRADVAQAMSAPDSKTVMHGFVLVIKEHNPEDIIALSTIDDRFLTLNYNINSEISKTKEAIKKLWPHSGLALKKILEKCFDDDNEILQFTRRQENENKVDSLLIKKQQVVNIDHAVLLDNETLIVNGWISKPDSQIDSINIYIDNKKIQISSFIQRYFRPDLVESMPWSDEHELGFVFILTNQNESQIDLEINIILSNNLSETIERKLTKLDWAEMPNFINIIPYAYEKLIFLLNDAVINEKSQNIWSDQLIELKRLHIDSIHRHAKIYLDQPEYFIAAIDYGYALGKDGLLFFGWCLPIQKPKSISLINDDGYEINISALLTPLRRLDLVEPFKARISNIEAESGFICYAQTPCLPGESRAICFNYGALGRFYLKIPTEKVKANTSLAIKEILRRIPDPNQMRYKLYDLFESGLGQALECINSKRLSAPEAQCREFGEPHAHPETSLLVPLYGRYDFLRYQLAQFADDADFNNSDLIYIVDDPSILNQTLELAAKYQPLFKIPFRVAWNGENRGFAAANNLGASLAIGSYLVLMNSDVIPKANGWLTTLKQALDTLPQAGVVAPLLQFGDDSVQHAGMYPRKDPLLPGFLLNTHKGMGMNWDSNSNAPSEHPMLTAACLMIKTALYKELGGLDEGYVIGDFEDADLCMMLRKNGYKLYLVPEAKLWHLERQSQALNDLADTRQLVTLFNGWRYLNKIKTGVIPAPSTNEAAI